MRKFQHYQTNIVQIAVRFMCIAKRAVREVQRLSDAIWWWWIFSIVSAIFKFIKSMLCSECEFDLLQFLGRKIAGIRSRPWITCELVGRIFYYTTSNGKHFEYFSMKTLKPMRTIVRQQNPPNPLQHDANQNENAAPNVCCKFFIRKQKRNQNCWWVYPFLCFIFHLRWLLWKKGEIFWKKKK